MALFYSNELLKLLEDNIFDLDLDICPIILSFVDSDVLESYNKLIKKTSKISKNSDTYGEISDRIQNDDCIGVEFSDSFIITISNDDQNIILCLLSLCANGCNFTEHECFCYKTCNIIEFIFKKKDFTIKNFLLAYLIFIKEISINIIYGFKIIDIINFLPNGLYYNILLNLGFIKSSLNNLDILYIKDLFKKLP